MRLYAATGGFNVNWVNFTSKGLVNNAIYRVEPACAPGKCLDVTGVGTADGANVQIWTWASGSNQKWKLIDIGGGYFKLEPACAPGKVLDVSSAANIDGANVQIYTDNGTNAQKWLFMQQ